jgi:hypothetical protein
MIRKTILALVAGTALIAAAAPASAGYYGGYSHGGYNHGGYGYNSYRSSYDCYTPSYGHGYRSSYGY